MVGLFSHPLIRRVRSAKAQRYQNPAIMAQFNIPLRAPWDWLPGGLVPSRLQRKTDGGPYIRGAPDVDGLPMRLYNVLTDGQTQSCAAFVPAPGSIRTIKTLEDPEQMFLLDADAIVAHLDQHIFLIYFIDAGYDGASLFAIFSGILHQVDQHH